MRRLARFALIPFVAALGLLLALPLVLTGCGTAQEGSTVAAKPAGVAAPSESTAGTSTPEKPKPALVGDRLANTSLEPIVMSKQTESSPFRFAEIAKEAGITFVHVSGMNKDKHFPTANGSGCSFFDYDNDGLLDVYYCNATFFPLGKTDTGSNRLYKNLGNNKFKDVTESSGLGYKGFCHGAVAGDVDNDGDQDVFLCNYGSNRLYLNNGDGTFTDVGKKAGIDRPGWSSAGAFLDYDNDGDLDLYVSNYGEWKYPEDAEPFCGDVEKKIRLYCSPRSIRTVKHFFYRNNGDGTFTDVYDQVIKTIDPETKQPKPRSDGHGFGVVTADLNDDGKIDIYVANDMNPNFLFLNNGDGTFEDVTESCGAAFDDKGQAQSGMGVDAEDVDGDGLPDLYVTNFQNEYNTLYQNLGKGTFLDSTPFFGLAADTTPWVGWGTALADFDNDGWPDNFVVNGHVDDNRKQLGENVDYEEPSLLFWNKGGKRFRLATRDAGPYFDGRHVGRGAAFGDVDNDGDVDILINHKDGPAALLRNDTPSKNHWVRVKLRGTKSNRDGVGAKVLVTSEGRTILRQRKGGYSMMASNDPRVLVGVGPSEVVDKLVVRWPSGLVSTLEKVKTDQEYEVVEPGPTKTAGLERGR